MKSSVPVTCPSCGEQINQETNGSQLPEYARCPSCQASIYLMAPLGNVVTRLMIERVTQELANGDTTIAILLSAMAVEGEMAYLFFKWKGIDSGKYLGSRTQNGQDTWEDDWAAMRSIGKRLDELSKFLTSAAFDEFALQNKAWLMPALDGFDPATSIKEFFQKELFDTRNRIVHYGEIDFGKPDGDRCFSLASALIGLLTAMDRERIKRMDGP